MNTLNDHICENNIFKSKKVFLFGLLQTVLKSVIKSHARQHINVFIIYSLFLHQNIAVLRTSTNAGYAGSVHAIRVSDGRLLPFFDTATM